MAGLEAELHALNDAYLTYLSDVPTEQLFGFRYMSDGGMITMLGWPQGGTASRRIDKVGREAATAPSLERFKAGFVELLPQAVEVVRRIRSWDEVRYVEPALLRCPRWWTLGRDHRARRPSGGRGVAAALRMQIIEDLTRRS